MWLLALVVLAIAAITYGVIYIVNVNLIIYKTGMYEFTVIVIYMTLIALVNTFKNNQTWQFYEDRYN